MTVEAPPKKQARLPGITDNHTQIPVFFVDVLMKNAGKHIPSSFWKFTWVLWRDIMKFGDAFEAERAVRQFYIDKNAAAKWVAAYSVSYLMKVELGYKHGDSETGIPTKFMLHKDRTQQDWVRFVEQLSLTLQIDRSLKLGHDDGFKLTLALRINASRKEAGLTPVNTDLLAEAQRKGLIVYDGEGGFDVKREGRILNVYVG